MSTKRISSGKPKHMAEVRRAGAAAITPILHLSRRPTTCPLAPDWPERLRPMSFGFLNPAEEAFMRAAHASELGAVLATIEAEWHVADDDRSQVTPSDASHLFAGFPCHVHTEFEIDGQIVHVDRTWANLWGPGRLKAEWHLFIDDVMAGFGGEMGCSLGLTVAIWPAVALLKDSRAIVILRPVHKSGVGLQQVLLDSPQIALHAVAQVAT